MLYITTTHFKFTGGDRIKLIETTAIKNERIFIMEEKVLIKSERYNVKKVFSVMALIGLILTIIYAVILMIQHDNYFLWWEHYVPLSLIPVASFALIGLLIFLWLRSYELTITDKRVYGKVAFGKRVDLPVDSVSATATIGLFKGVSVSTSSGKISFLAIKNANEIYDVINNLLVDRQKEKTQNTGTTIVQNSDEADQLKKYKDLLDSGVITQEEFDAKKKQLLGL